MTKTLKISLIAAAFTMLTGCSASNPFGVGHEKSSCEISGGFGVCGSPKDIYIHKDRIKDIQSDYMTSGYEDEVFFAVSPKGDILVKEERGEGSWEKYDTSKIREEIEQRLSEKNKKPFGVFSDGSESSPKVDINSMSQDVPVTAENDLSVVYQKQKFLLETPEVGGMIRDSGKIQKLWLAPVVDKKDNLVSARTVMVVLSEPKWVIGEKTPKTTNKNIIPTPMSEELLKKQQTYNTHNEDVVRHFNNGNVGGLKEAIQNNPDKLDKEMQNDLIEINKFLER